MIYKYLLLISILLSYQVMAQRNYLLIQCSPKECGDLPKITDRCYTSLDSSGFQRFVREVYDQSTDKVNIMKIPATLDVVTVTDSVLFSYFSNREVDPFQRDTAGRFYMQVAVGFNRKQIHSYRLYGIMDCILLLDRTVERLKRINPNLDSIESLNNLQNILIYDRMCKCFEP